MSEPGHWFESNPLWFKTAVFYEIHTRAFFDGNDDGSGDFRGLMQKLDYLQWLGIDCIWLLPFYPSPLKDGGYDIADFYAINPDYGTVEDFRGFVEAAHERGMRVIADLVMNHTSADHPWFQESRADRNGLKGDWYVWSDTDEPYRDARIIFIDTEVSNWTFDPVREQFYWHRFFSHQPDLNYENPEVRTAMLEVLRFWLDVGLDGFRLDAVPYLFEEEGTNCENLPRTHEYLRRVRTEIDEHYPDRVLLAEANQWPEDVVAYFGNGDECHMAFHFPVMPRMFMALRREEAKPMIEILDRTPAIPTTTQWGLFLRNHDELTLEMVTDEERDYMYSEYANDPRMKLNLGIRRRLAPLLDGGRDEIELMHAILFSLPGSPVLYYGDEIAMGDNVYLGDRDGVRTPMQWTGDRNGGFSRADFAQLYLPPLMDPVYGFQAVNVEAQLRTPTSLLRWLRRFVELRKQHPVFGLGDYRVLRPENPKIFAHIRSFSEDIVLCVHNLARSAQAVELDLSAFAGRVPVELFGNTEFPRIGELPYLLTLGPRGFFWFQLQDPADDVRSFTTKHGCPARWAARSCVLSRGHSAATVAPCVLVSHSPIAPGQRVSMTLTSETASSRETCTSSTGSSCSGRSPRSAGSAASRGTCWMRVSSTRASSPATRRSWPSRSSRCATGFRATICTTCRSASGPRRTTGRPPSSLRQMGGRSMTRSRIPTSSGGSSTWSRTTGRSTSAKQRSCSAAPATSGTVSARAPRSGRWVPSSRTARW